MERTTRRRLLFWPLILLTALAVYFFGIHPRQHMLVQARQTEDILQPRLAADPRFSAVRVARASNGSVFLVGEVSSESDLHGLEHLVADANPPLQPFIRVRVSSN